jgi:vacuolar-type H+-ATPase subunit H
MAWFQKEMDYARDSLAEAAEKSIDKAGERLSDVVREGVQQAGSELKDVIAGASQEIDAKLDKISLELHNQRQFTKDDVKELVDYAADRLTGVLDERIQILKHEISALVEDKTEYFKAEIDTFFIQRQQDLARERRRMVVNIGLAFVASLAVGGVSLFYRGLGEGEVDMLTVFRIVLASLVGGYVVFLAGSLLHRWLSLSEHRKDALFLAARYWGWLRPGSLFSSFLLLVGLLLVSVILLFPDEAVQLMRLDELLQGFRQGP